MKVYLDLDGVLVDFRRGICEAFGREPSTNWVFWDCWEGITTDLVNRVCNRDFWANLFWTADGQTMLYGSQPNIMDTFNDITILTTPMPNSETWTGKYQWIKKHLPARLANNVIMLNTSKARLANPDTLLIDDKDQNIEEFVAAGGRGILVPRPWNSLHGWSHESAQIVRNCLEGF